MGLAVRHDARLQRKCASREPERRFRQRNIFGAFKRRRIYNQVRIESPGTMATPNDDIGSAATNSSAAETLYPLTSALPLLSAILGGALLAWAGVAV